MHAIAKKRSRKLQFTVKEAGVKEAPNRRYSRETFHPDALDFF